MGGVFQYIWVDDFEERVIPRDIAESARFRIDGWPDKRCTVRNARFMAWLSECPWEIYDEDSEENEDDSPRYTITDKGRELLGGGDGE